MTYYRDQGLTFVVILAINNFDQDLTFSSFYSFVPLTQLYNLNILLIYL